MAFKIDTREKFHVIKPDETNLSANMTAELEQHLAILLNTPVKNVILNVTGVVAMDINFAEFLVKKQQWYYEQQFSFVICCLEVVLEDWLDAEGLLEMMNVTPTESEAWDIVQMEEIEREFMSEEEDGKE